MKRRQFLKQATLASLLLSSPIRAAKKARVVFVGGGVGALSALNLLNFLLPDLKITLIEKNKRYASGPFTNFVIAGEWGLNQITHDYHQWSVRDNVDIIQSTVKLIDKSAVHLYDGTQISYDYVVVAPGISFDFSQMPGVSEKNNEMVPHAWGGERQTLVLHQKLMNLPKNGVVIIIPPQLPYSCPPAPYDRAGLMAYWMEKKCPQGKILILDSKEQFPQQTLFDTDWNTYYSDRIEWRSAETGGKVENIDIKKLSVFTEFGEEKADLINYIPPQLAAKVALDSGLTNESGWCPVTLSTMESTLIPKVYVVGDATLFFSMPKSAQSAVRQGEIAAKAIYQQLTETEHLSVVLDYFCYSYVSPNYAFVEKGSYSINQKKQLQLDDIALAHPDDTIGKRQQVAKEGIQWYQQHFSSLFTPSHDKFG